MSWKPCRGHGIMFQNAFDREMKYRMLLSEYAYHPVGFMEHSKTYYHWLVAERDLRNINFPSSKISIEDLFGEHISERVVEGMRRHKDLCYKKIQRFLN